MYVIQNNVELSEADPTWYIIYSFVFAGSFEVENLKKWNYIMQYAGVVAYDEDIRLEPNQKHWK